MSKHRAEAPQSPLPLIGAFVVVLALVAGLFVWASAGDEAVVARDDLAVAVNAQADQVALDTEEFTVRGLGNFQHGETVRKVEPVCSRAPVSARITVLSYNIKSARVSSLGTIAGVIRNSGADVVLLQEVDRNRHGSGKVDQAAWLANNLGGWHHAFGQNVSHGATGGYGTAVVSRWPIVSSNNWHLPNGGGGQQRGLLKAVVDIDGVHVSFYSTHLQNRIDHLKVKQARSIAGIVAGDGNPRVIGGDMNSWPGDTPAKILKSQFTDTWEVVGRGAGATNPARRPRGRIDYLMYRGSELSPVSADVLGSLASDHRAVRASYDLSGLTEKVCTTPTPKALRP